jgi:hypothetical protein
VEQAHELLGQTLAGVPVGVVVLNGLRREIQAKVLANELADLARLIEAGQADAYKLSNVFGDLGLAVSFTVLNHFGKRSKSRSSGGIVIRYSKLLLI